MFDVIDGNDPTISINLFNKLNLYENIDTRSRVKVADILLSDDGLGNNLLLLGNNRDEQYFEIIDNSLYLKAGTNIDYESLNQLSVAIIVDDTLYFSDEPYLSYADAGVVDYTNIDQDNYAGVVDYTNIEQDNDAGVVDYTNIDQNNISDAVIVSNYNSESTNSGVELTGDAVSGGVQLDSGSTNSEVELTDDAVSGGVQLDSGSTNSEVELTDDAVSGGVQLEGISKVQAKLVSSQVKVLITKRFKTIA